MAVITSVLTLVLLSSVVIRSVSCQYDMFYEDNQVAKREYNIPSIIYKIEELLENQNSKYQQSNRISLFPNDRLSNCLQKEITVKLEDKDRDFRPSILKNIYCINIHNGEKACSVRKLKCVQKYEKVMIGWRKRGSGLPHCWEHTEYNRPSGCQCAP